MGKRYSQGAMPANPAGLALLAPDPAVLARNFGPEGVLQQAGFEGQSLHPIEGGRHTTPN